MHYENHVIYCANNRIQIVCNNFMTEEYIKIDETAEDIRNLYFVLKQLFERNPLKSNKGNHLENRNVA